MASLATTSTVSLPRRRNAMPRRAGLVVGVAVGAAFVGLGQAFSVVELMRLDGLPWIAPTIVTGAAVGWLFGPAAWRADGRGYWLAIVVGQALVAVTIGAVAVVVEGFLLAAFAEGAAVTELPAAVLGSVFLVMYGLVLLGWAVAPFTLAAALAWSLAMAGLRRLAR